MLFIESKEKVIKAKEKVSVIESNDIRNMYVAKQIVEGYNFGRKLTDEERKAILKAILSSSSLNEKKSRKYLSTLIQNMEQIGLDTQEIYGMIINLVINRKVIEETGYDYESLLQNKNNVCQTIAEYKDKIETNITEDTILKAKADYLSKKDGENLKEELIKLGLDREFIELKNISNVYVAKQIVEGYDFGRELTTEERKAILKAILSSSTLNDKKTGCYYLSSLIHKMEQIRLDTQEIYGMIINLGINGKVIEKRGYSYTNLLSNLNNACKEIANYKDEIETSVKESTIQKAVKKANKPNKPKKVTGQAIAKKTVEITTKGSGGSEICDLVEADYQRLLDEKINENEKEGSEQDDTN